MSLFHLLFYLFLTCWQIYGADSVWSESSSISCDCMAHLTATGMGRGMTIGCIIHVISAGIFSLVFWWQMIQFCGTATVDCCFWLWSFIWKGN